MIDETKNSQDSVKKDLSALGSIYDYTKDWVDALEDGELDRRERENLISTSSGMLVDGLEQSGRIASKTAGILGAYSTAVELAKEPENEEERARISTNVEIARSFLAGDELRDFAKEDIASRTDDLQEKFDRADKQLDAAMHALGNFSMDFPSYNPPGFGSPGTAAPSFNYDFNLNTSYALDITESIEDTSDLAEDAIDDEEAASSYQNDLDGGNYDDGTSSSGWDGFEGDFGTGGFDASCEY